MERVYTPTDVSHNIKESGGRRDHGNREKSEKKKYIKKAKRGISCKCIIIITIYTTCICNSSGQLPV